MQMRFDGVTRRDRVPHYLDGASTLDDVNRGFEVMEAPAGIRSGIAF